MAERRTIRQQLSCKGKREEGRKEGRKEERKGKCNSRRNGLKEAAGWTDGQN
jgi:hypothetical protein